MVLLVPEQPKLRVCGIVADCEQISAASLVEHIAEKTSASKVKIKKACGMSPTPDNLAEHQSNSEGGEWYQVCRLDGHRDLYRVWPTLKKQEWATEVGEETANAE